MMKKVTYLLGIVFLLCLFFLTSCDNQLPHARQLVKIHSLYEGLISHDRLKSELAENNVDIPFYASKPGSVLHAVVIPFNISDVSNGVTYDEVRVTMTLLERDGTTYFDDTGNIAVVAVIPEHVDRSVNVEGASNVAVKIAASAAALSGEMSGGQTNKESYARLYRQVHASYPTGTGTTVVWTFRPFRDEPIFPGRYFLIAFVEVRDQSHEFLATVHSNCMYGVPTWFGLSRETGYCTSDTAKLVLSETADIL